MTQSRYLEYLPAIFQSDNLEQPEAFLGEFLLPFEEQLTAYETLLAILADYFDVELTAPDYLPWLAKWVALTLDPNWNEAMRRRLIREAMALHRIRGTHAGIKRLLAIWDEQCTVQLREHHWPGGMQIGVSSQIGGTSANAPLPAQFEVKARQNSSTPQTYYVIEPVGNPTVSGEPAKATKDRPRFIYYRADQVKRVETGGKAETTTVVIERFDGSTDTYESATITRTDQATPGHYTLTAGAITAGATVIEYWGDTFLTEGVERPYCFTAEIALPDRVELFAIPVKPATWMDFNQADWQRICTDHGLIFSQNVQIEKVGDGTRWWKINDGDRFFVAEKRGQSLHFFQQMYGESPRDKLQADGASVQTIINEMKPAHTHCYLTVRPVPREPHLAPMQIGVRSSIALDTIIS